MEIITGLLATIMSTIDSLGFISAFTFGRDIVGRFKKVNSDSVFLTRIGLILMAMIAVILAYSFPSVVKLWYINGSIFVPGLLVPFLLTFTNIRITKKQGLVITIVPVLISLTWFSFSIINFPHSIFNLEPFYPGIISSIFLFIIFKINDK